MLSPLVSYAMVGVDSSMVFDVIASMAYLPKACYVFPRMAYVSMGSVSTVAVSA